MEPQDTVFCYDNKEDKCNNRKCSKIVTFILAVILGLLLVLSIILLFCNRRKKDRKCKCCY